MVARIGRLSWLWRGVAIVAVLVVAAAGFVIAQYATAASMSGVHPSDGSILSSADVVLRAGLPDFKPDSAEVRLIVDGQEVPLDQVKQEPGEVRHTREFADGPHQVEVELTSRNIFARRLVQSWRFVVDTSAPQVDILKPFPANAVSASDVAFATRFSEHAEAVLIVDQRRVSLSNHGSSAGGRLELQEGRHRLELQVTDRAGNMTTKTWEAWADFSAPTGTLLAWPTGKVGKANLEVLLEIRDNMPEGLTVSVMLDGNPLQVQDVGEKAAEKESGSGNRVNRGHDSSAGPLAPTARRFRAIATGLAEGNHHVSLEARDRGGHVWRKESSFLVDSTDAFGPRELLPGATGKDVTVLQQILARKGFYQGEFTALFDKRTSAAVIAFRRARGMTPAPAVDQATLRRLVGSMRIDISERRLYLYDEGKLVKTYPVAVGQPRYPTPRGNWEVIVKEYHPTWDPPPSPWAAGLEPVPPGPGNPLGTRWIGLSAPAVGIHGTYSSWSVGTAASHGCIRMYIRDIEELFDLIYVGTPIEIVR